MSHIGKSIDAETRTVVCIAELKPTDRSSFVNGLYVETQVVTCQRQAPAIPSQAFIEADDFYYVLTLDRKKGENIILKKIPVNLGVILEDYAEVMDEGLKDILIEGSYNLLTGE